METEKTVGQKAAQTLLDIFDNYPGRYYYSGTPSHGTSWGGLVAKENTFPHKSETTAWEYMKGYMLGADVDYIQHTLIGIANGNITVGNHHLFELLKKTIQKYGDSPLQSNIEGHADTPSFAEAMEPALKQAFESGILVENNPLVGHVR